MSFRVVLVPSLNQKGFTKNCEDFAEVSDAMNQCHAWKRISVRTSEAPEHERRRRGFNRTRGVGERCEEKVLREKWGGERGMKVYVHEHFRRCCESLCYNIPLRLFCLIK